MRAYEIRPGFGLDNLVCTERRAPTPGPGQVVMRVRACSLNYRDLLMVRGQYNKRMPLPVVPLSDGMGEIAGVGEGVKRVAVGDRVAACFVQGLVSRPLARDGLHLQQTLGGPLDGMLAEQVLLPEDGVTKVPDHLTDEEAATLPCAALTAWSAMFGQSNFTTGDTLVVQGTGGVSLFALQFATLIGARAIVTSSSDAKLERARELGAHATINYRTVPEWGKEVKRLTGIGADHIIEVGGSGTLEQSIKAVRANGTISLIGVLAGSAGPVNLLPVLMRNLRLQGVFVGSRNELDAMNRAIAHSGLRPVIDQVFSFDDAHAAFHHLASGKHFGKVCIRVAE